MTGKLLIIATAITTALLISTGAYAGGGMGGGMGGGQGMAGGQGHGMMGSDGNDMMGSGQNFSSPRASQPRRSPADHYKMQEKEKLREEIRERRQELSDLYRSDKPDNALIDKKIAELNKLETAYDRSVSETN
jgi:Spy/CpxP family protein refolding chaperone